MFDNLDPDAVREVVARHSDFGYPLWDAEPAGR